MLGEGDDAFDVPLLGARFVEVHLGLRQFLLHSVTLLLVHSLADRARVDEGLFQALQALLKFGDARRADLSKVSGLALLGAPDIDDDSPEEPQVRPRGLQRFQVRKERGFGSLPAAPDASAFRAVVVSVTAVPALRPATGNRALAVRASQEPAKREIVTIPDVPRGFGARGEPLLDAPEDGLTDDAFEIAGPGDTPFGHVDAPDEHAVPQQRPKGLKADRLPLVRPEAGGRYLPQNVGHFRSCADFGEGEPQQLETSGIRNQARGALRTGVQVAEGGLESEPAQLQRGPHAGRGALGLHVVVELGERRDNALHQPPG